MEYPKFKEPEPLIRNTGTLVPPPKDGEHIELEKGPNIAPLPTVPRDPDNGNPFFHWMNPSSFTSDRYNVSYHGTAHSHLDALCHYQLQGVLFDGLVTMKNNIGNTTTSVGGCIKYGIDNLRDGIVTKAVLFDATLLPHLRERINGVEQPWLAPGTHVHKSDLEMLEKIERVKHLLGDLQAGLSREELQQVAPLRLEHERASKSGPFPDSQQAHEIQGPLLNRAQPKETR